MTEEELQMIGDAVEEAFDDAQDEGYAPDVDSLAIAALREHVRTLVVQKVRARG